MRSDAERLRDILDAIDQIRKYSSKGREAFNQDELVQVWIVHHLARLGEAVARLSPRLRKQRLAPWKEIIGMRNIVCPRILPYRFGHSLDRSGSSSPTARKAGAEDTGRAQRAMTRC